MQNALRSLAPVWTSRSTATRCLLGTAAGRIELAKWDERVIKEIKQLFLVVDPSQIHAMFKVSRLRPVNKSRSNLSGMSTEGRERILKNLWTSGPST